MYGFRSRQHGQTKPSAPQLLYIVLVYTLERQPASGSSRFFILQESRHKRSVNTYSSTVLTLEIRPATLSSVREHVWCVSLEEIEIRIVRLGQTSRPHPCVGNYDRGQIYYHYAMLVPAPRKAARRGGSTAWACARGRRASGRP